MSLDEALIRRNMKAELRKRMRQLRNTTPESAIAARSARIVEQLLGMPEVKAAKALASFWPILERHEVDLRALDPALRSKGVRLAYPWIDRTTKDMTFRFLDDAKALKDGGLGFLEPPDDAPVADSLDVIVVPALAVDPRGHRLGYGAGFYDRALAKSKATTIAVAFDFQVMVEIPITDDDVPVKWIATDMRVLAAT